MTDDFEVVWSGTMSRNGEGLVLVPDRDTRSINYEAPARIYNKTGKHSKKSKETDDDAQERGSDGSSDDSTNDGCESGDLD